MNQSLPPFPRSPFLSGLNDEGPTELNGRQATATCLQAGYRRPPVGLQRLAAVRNRPMMAAETRIIGHDAQPEHHVVPPVHRDLRRHRRGRGRCAKRHDANPKFELLHLTLLIKRVIDIGAIGLRRLAVMSKVDQCVLPLVSLN